MSKINKLNLGQRIAFEAAKAGWNMFITGGGGVGKSFLIEVIATYLKGIILTAPTGMSALNISGQTIHSFFGIPINPIDIFESAELKNGEREKLRAAKIILIDEVSMLRVDTIEIIDIKVRNATGINKPFGGKQVIFVGDMCQVEPFKPKDARYNGELMSRYGSLFAFKSNAWEELNPVPFILTEPVRHGHEGLVRTLRNLRMGKDVERCVDFLNENCAKSPTDDILRLFTTNVKCDKWNEKHIETIDAKSMKYKSSIKGNFKQRPSPEDLELKVGARVILTANDPNGLYMNGEMGTVKRLAKASATVTLDRGKVVEVKKKTWEEVSYETQTEEVEVEADDSEDLEKKVAASFSQLPLKLGYAITTHKSQGMTLDQGVLDLGGGTFSCGQGYVAVSRIKTLEHFYLQSKLKASFFKFNSEAIDFTFECSKIALSRMKEDIKTFGIDEEAFNKNKPEFKINVIKTKIDNVFNDSNLSTSDAIIALTELNISAYMSSTKGGFSFEGVKFRAEQIYGTSMKEVLTCFNGIEREIDSDIEDELLHNYKRLKDGTVLEHKDLEYSVFERNLIEAENITQKLLEDMKKIGYCERRTAKLINSHSTNKEKV